MTTANYFRQDNTENYEQAELDAMNAELSERMQGVDENSDDYQDLLKAEGDKVFNEHC